MTEELDIHSNNQKFTVLIILAICLLALSACLRSKETAQSSNNQDQVIARQGTQVGNASEAFSASTKFRTIAFPDNVELGTISIRTDPEKYHSLGMVTGPRRVPAHAFVRLELIPGEYADLRKLGELKPDDIQELQAGRALFRENDLKWISHLSGLIRLDLSNTSVTDKGLAYLSELSSLRALQLVNTNVQGDGLSQLARCKKLEEIQLAGSKFNDQNASKLLSVKQIGWLFLYDTPVTDKALPAIAQLTNLGLLDLGRTGITGKGLRCLTPLHKLGTCVLEWTDVGDEDIPSILQIGRLQELSLTGTKITNRALPLLAERNWRRLSFGSDDIDDSGVAQLSKIRSLVVLDLNKTKVDDKGLRSLQTLNNLQVLNLNDTRVTDAGLAQLVTLKQLKELELRETTVTDEGLKYLQGLPLARVDLYGTRVSKAGLARFRASMPHTRIEY
jgi:hypothetical protein